MKRYNLHIITFIIGLFLLSACQDEELIKKGSEVEEGIPVTAQLYFSSENRDDKVITKGGLETTVEYKVSDLYVYVFRSVNGKFVKELGQQFDEKNGLTVTLQEVDAEWKTAGSVTLKITSGAKKIFAIANTGTGSHYSMSKALEEVETLDDLKELSAALQDADVPVDRGSGQFLMSGSFAPNENSDFTSATSGDVSINASGKPTTEGKLFLKHLDSRIEFKIKALPSGNANDKGERAQKITFIPKGYRVVNVPIASFVLENPYSGSEGSTHDVSGDSDDNAAAYRDTKPDGSYTNFDNLLKDEQNNNNIGGEFTFYMFENRKRALNEIADYADRERQEKAPMNGAYINAHKYATYVEMTGSYQEQYTDDSGELKEKTAEVKYTIHLGFVEGNSDFRSERGCKYTYNVTIRGVDNIELEVTSSNDEDSGVIENQPGAEGDVVKSKQFYYVDAHYVVDRIVFNKDNVSEDASFRVKTPFDRDGRDIDAKDIEWVWFVKNTKGKVGGDIITYTYRDLTQAGVLGAINKYKAETVTDQRQNSPKTYTRSSSVSREYILAWQWYYDNVESKTEPVSAKWEYPESGFVAFPSEPARINIKELIALLKAEKDKPVDENSLYDSNGNAAFTVFIDEYYYDKSPIDNTSVHWRQFVNGDNREMHILCDTEFSEDKESSLTTSNFLISQKPIRTFYNSNQETGWGVESVNEPVRSSSNEVKPDGRLKIENSGVISNQSNSNGRYNMFMNVGYRSDSSWSTYIDPKTNFINKVQNIAMLQQACMQRNRDLNGDGTIQHNEVRWYLPAINQMTGLFLGKDALPLEVHLMENGVTVTRTETNNGKDANGNYRDFHYTNSNNIQFWAEEGAATGANSMNNGFWNYRCVRNLGVSYDSNTAPAANNETSDYASSRADSEGILIDLTAVNTNALRQTDDKGDPLAPTDENSEYNRPYTKFLVKKSLTNGSVLKSDIYDNKVTNPCPRGWRMPNMRELTLILAYSGFTTDGENVAAFSQTTSSLSYKSTKKNVYHMVNGNITLGDTGSAQVRCVKDVK